MSSTVAGAISTESRDAFYAAAVLGLRALDGRERVARRFGVEADARWAAFKGALRDGDRIDVLLRDGAVSWGAAFSPAEAFGLFGLAPDDPFGPDWVPTTEANARRWLGADSDSGSGSLAQVIDALGVAARPVELPTLTASTRVAVAGGAALVAVMTAFSRQAGLSWSDQVLAVATAPGHRQLAGLAAVFAGASARTRLVRPGGDVRAVLKQAGFAQVDVAVVSDDAEPECAVFACRAAGGS